MPLLAGVWKANVNGSEIEIRIGQQNGPDGTIQITYPAALGPREALGIWSEAAQRLVFAVTGEQAPNPSVMLFEGYLIRTPSSPAPGQDVVLMLAGTVEVPFSSGDATLPAFPSARRTTFGWIARATEVN